MPQNMRRTIHFPPKELSLSANRNDLPIQECALNSLWRESGEHDFIRDYFDITEL
jgi:hypothetical protein